MDRASRRWVDSGPVTVFVMACGRMGLGHSWTVALGDDGPLSICEQRAATSEPCALLSSRWRLPTALASREPRRS